MKKLNKKGFTLVEIVIVIVIIAILAAMLIPALTKWIDKSRQKTFLNNCDTIKTAVATAMSEAYAENSHVKNIAVAVKELEDENFSATSDDTNPSNTLTSSVGQNVYISDVKRNEKTQFRVACNSWADDMAITDGKYSVRWVNGGWTDIVNLDKNNTPYNVTTSMVNAEG